MKYFTILCLLATALAAPAPQAGKPATPASCPGASNPKAQPAAAAASNPKSQPATAAAAGNNCTTAIQTKLMQGIQANLDIQKQELEGVKSLQSQSGTPEFASTQKSVIAIQQQGIKIREQNQKFAAEINSPASAGLATVAGAQTTELGQVMGLKGTAEDKATLKMLVKEVEDGTKQNMKNLKEAEGQKCGGSKSG